MDFRIQLLHYYFFFIVSDISDVKVIMSSTVSVIFAVN